ncbi:serine/threonine protein kinase [Kitasatospora sp. GP30]|uniref:WD40 repeat domain-containing serine/threonine protein kinase n=1 Tax=Kitasatospora sp. GP30 TaxID=3035084 RepID=UPI000CC37607|nr:serine/threonine-protein kinase [Kitasatospora sp. GP30]MDH6140356.1 serine/threonine protein kinase [Kitasatospora sp. GP30]
MSQRVIGGRFRLMSMLGSGGFGQVWSAFDEKLGVEVAIKQIRLDPSATDVERAATVTDAENEARNAAKLRDHPNIVAVYDVVIAAGEPWLVMRLVKGRTLAQEIRARGRLHPDEAGKIAAGVLAALGAAHAAGIVHRDVKPANIMLADDGTVLLTDFGIAKQHTNTTQAVVMGTLPYMSPERLNGKDLPAGDLFAVGAIIYEMTEGVSPFARATPTAIMSAVALEQPPPPQHADRLTALILALLEKDPAKRPNVTAAQVLLTGRSAFPTEEATIDAPAVQDQDVVCTRVDQELTRRWRPSRRGVLVAGLGLATAATIPVALTIYPSSRSTGASKRPIAAPDTTSGSVRPQGPVTLSDGGSASPLAVSFNPASTLLASVGEDGAVRLWNTATWKSAKTFAHQAVNPWSKPLDQVIAFNSRFTAALSLAFSPDGAVLAVGNGDGTISLWNIADGTETTLPYLDPVEWNGATSSVSFAPGGGRLAATYDAPAIRIWDVATRTSLATLTTGDTSWVAQVAFSPSGQILASASGNGNPNNTVTDGRLQLWDTSSRTRIATLTDSNSPWQSLAFSLDGKTLANLRSDGEITLWDVAARTATGTLASSDSGVTCVAFGAGGVLAGGFKDGTITLWDTGSGKSIDVLATGTDSTVNCVAFSPDGKTIASAAKNLTVWTLKQ